jgi:GTP-binding protein Era
MTQQLQNLRHSGTCAIVGLPNVGKSTLLNRLLGVRLMAVSPKPQTTRNRVMGAVNRDLDGTACQVVFVDTPGVQAGKGALRKFMREEALSAALDCDAVMLLVDVTRSDQTSLEALRQGPARALLETLDNFSGPIVLALNKIDRLADKELLLPILEAFSATGKFAGLVPISAKNGSGTERLLREIALFLPEGPPLFPEEMFTDKAERFLAGEFIREQLFHQLGDELPYASAVQVESFTEREAGDVAISAVILVERDSQKGIVIGKGGARIKSVGEKARANIAKLLGCPVHLKLFVKVKANWSAHEATLRDLGYER